MMNLCAARKVCFWNVLFVCVVVVVFLFVGVVFFCFVFFISLLTFLSSRSSVILKICMRIKTPREALTGFRYRAVV